MLETLKSHLEEPKSVDSLEKQDKKMATPEQVDEIINTGMSGLQIESEKIIEMNSRVEAISSDPDTDPTDLSLADSKIRQLDQEAKQVVTETEDIFDQWRKESEVRRSTETQRSKELEQKVFENYHDDPLIEKLEKEILTRTNADASVRNNQKAGGVDSHSDSWHRINYREDMHNWDRFIQSYPEKAKAYAKQGHPGIARALTREAGKTDATNSARSFMDILQEQENKRFDKSQKPKPGKTFITVTAGGEKKDDFDITVDGNQSGSADGKKWVDDFDITVDGKNSIDDIDITLGDSRVIDKRFAEIPAENDEIEIISTREISSEENTKSSAIKEKINSAMQPMINRYRKMFPGMSTESKGLTQEEQTQRRNSLRLEMRKQELDNLPKIVSGMKFRSERPLGNHFNQEQGYSCTLASTLNAMEALGQRNLLNERQLAEQIGEDGSQGAIGIEKTLDYLKENGFSVHEVGSVSQMISELSDGKVIMMTVPGDINHRVVVSSFEIRDGKISFLWNDPLKEKAHWTSLEAIIKRFVYDPDMMFMCESIGK